MPVLFPVFQADGCYYWASKGILKVFTMANPRISARRQLRPLGLLLALATVLLAGALQAAPAVDVQRVPDDGIHPRLLTDGQGNVHLLYFRKRFSNPRARDGDLYYRQYNKNTGAWGNAVKVSSESFNYADPVYRAGMAVDGEGRVQVVWYRSRPSAYYFSRSNPERSAFEPQRSMVSDNLEGVDAGADIAAHDNMVAIVWAAGDLTREPERTVFVRLSLDHGATFSDEIMIGDKSLGACSCCGLAAQYNDQHQLHVAYRSAINGSGRHMQLLTLDALNADPASSYYDVLNELRRWDLSACPVTTNDIVRDQQQQDWLVYENRNRIGLMNITAGTQPFLVAEPEQPTRQKHPSVAFDKEGNRLVVWGEGISFTRGGKLAAALFDAEGRQEMDFHVNPDDITDYSSPAAAARPGGGFLILY